MRIAQVIPDRLYTLVLPEGGFAFDVCFEQWKDPGYLYEFFLCNSAALDYYSVDAKTAVEMVMVESENFFCDVMDAAKKAGNIELDHDIFEPLFSKEAFDLPIVASKSYGSNKKKPFCRMYAVRLSDGAYIVAGGLIKITRALQECEEGNSMLRTLKQLKSFLEFKGIIDSFDIDPFLSEIE